MTALLTLEHTRDLDEWATVPDIPIPQEVGVDLQPGDRITVREALYALLLESANDAALTLASHVAGSEPRFVVLMNRRAKQFGMTHTHFANSRGTAEPGFYSSARDLATLARRAMRKATFRRIVSTRQATIEYPPDAAIPVKNHNRLLGYAWADGVKTGSNDASGKVLVGSGKPGARPAHRGDHARAHARAGGQGRRGALHVGHGRVPAALGRLVALGLSLTPPRPAGLTIVRRTAPPALASGTRSARPIAPARPARARC